MYRLNGAELTAVSGGNAVDLFAQRCAELAQRFGPEAASRMQVQTSTRMVSRVRSDASVSGRLRKIFDGALGIGGDGEFEQQDSVSAYCPAPSEVPGDDEERREEKQ